ncbi:MAG: hypothetical protein ACOCRX_09390 [Candidatus Woesearchaeota archaeon]
MDSKIKEPVFNVDKIRENKYLVKRKLSEKEKKEVNLAINRIGKYSFVFLKSRLEGYNNRLSLFEELLNIYKKKTNTIKKDSTDADKIKEIQSIKLDLLSKMFMIMEDLAYMSKACYKFRTEDEDICETYLNATQPDNIFESFVRKNDCKRKIKRLMMYPDEKSEINNIISDLNEKEKKEAWKHIQKSLNYIIETFNSAIEIFNDFKRIYNKYKHGLTQIYPYTCDGTEFNISIPSNIKGEKQIKNYINKKIFRDVWLLDAQGENIQLKGPLNYSYEKINSVFNTTITNFAKLYKALVQIYLNWGKREAYLGFVMKSGSKNVPKKLGKKLKDSQYYVFE